MSVDPSVLILRLRLRVAAWLAVAFAAVPLLVLTVFRGPAAFALPRPERWWPPTIEILQNAPGEDLMGMLVLCAMVPRQRFCTTP
jgi:hypothetical protein